MAKAQDGGLSVILYKIMDYVNHIPLFFTKQQPFMGEAPSLRYSLYPTTIWELPRIMDQSYEFGHVGSSLHYRDSTAPNGSFRQRRHSGTIDSFFEF